MFDGMKQRLCAKAGFNTGDPAQLNRCDAELISAMNLYGVAGASSLPYLRSVALARSISETMESADFSAATSRLINRQIMAEGMGSSQAMNEWVPKIRGYLLAVVLGMIPLAALFIMTPLVGKALMLVFGMFTWLTFWGITDAVASQMAYDMAFDAFQDIRTFGLGFEAFLHSPEASVKALGLFSKARTTSLILATVLSGALLGFGGFALTSFAQSLQSHFDQAGEAAGRQVALPEENTALQQRLLAVPGVQAALSRAGFDTAGLASGSSTMQSLGGAEAMITSALGGRPSPGRMNTAIGQANMGRQMGSAEGYAAGSGQGLGGVTEQAIRSESVNTQQSSVSSIARGSELSSMKGGINAAASFQGRQEAADLDSFRSVYSTLNGTDQISSDGLRNMASMFKASPLGLANALQEKGYSSADAARSFQLQSERLLSYADTLDRDPTAMDRIGQSQALRDITSSDAFRAAASTAGLASIRTGEQFAIESTAATGRAATATGSSWSTAQRVSNLSMGRQLGEADRMEAVSQFLGLDGSSVAGIATATETEGLSRVSIPITPNNYGSVVGGLMANGLIDDQGNALLSRHQGGVATLTLDPETNRPTSSTIEAGNKLFTYDLNQATSGSVIRDQHVDTREFDSSNRISGGYMAIMPQNLAPITDLIYSDTEMGARQDASLQLASQIAQHWTQLGLSETIESSTGTARQIGLGGNASSGLSGSGIARGLGISGSLSGSTSNFDNDSASFRVDNVKAHAIELLSNLETEIYNEFMDSRPPDAPPPSMNELNRALEEGVNQRLPIEFTNATQRMERLRDLELSDLREEAEPNGR